MHKNLMVLGTASSAGKSLITTALCKIFYEKGYSVTPFKSQNMSLNSFVTEDGKEMGRAQVIQAEACGLKPQVFMNPILLKPNSDNGSQVIFMGKALQNMEASEYFEFRKTLKLKVQEIYEKEVKEKFEISIIEGAGSPAEINLNREDLVNIGMAKIAKSPCILVADIDKGGVFASIYGTIMLLPEEDRRYIKGIIINKFRGDVEILKPGLKMIEDLVNVPVIGVIPYINHGVEEEDSASERATATFGEGNIKVKVIRLPHMSNFNDLDPFKMHDCNVEFVETPKELDNANLIIIPGSKNTIYDLNFIKKMGFKEKLEDAVSKGIIVLGICGGLQILGKTIRDPYNIEGSKDFEEGLGFLNIDTILEKEKNTTQFDGESIIDIDYINFSEGQKFYGYEIHQGKSSGSEKVFLKNKGNDIGFYKENIIGTYLHGLFEEGEFLKGILDFLNKKNDTESKSFKLFKENEYKKLAEIVEKNLDMKKIYEIMGLENEFDV